MGILREAVAVGFMGQRGGARPPRSYHRNQADASRYQRHGVVYMVSIYACLAALMLDLAPLWSLAPVIAVCYVRGALLTHELMHIRRPSRVTWLLRMMMLFETPFGLGYREHQDIHLRHHQQPATAGDPEYFQIRGGSSRAFLAALLSPELAAGKWVLTRGISPSLRREGAVRALLMLTLVALAPVAFLGYWLVLRVTVGISNFLFHHALHYRSGRYGTFSLSLPAPLHAGLHLVLGSSLAAVLCEHDAHHAWASVRAEHLRGLLDSFPPRSPAEARQ